MWVAPPEGVGVKRTPHFVVCTPQGVQRNSASCTTAMRSVFPTVESPVRTLLINQASPVSAERSFSGLRRLKYRTFGRHVVSLA